MMLSFTYCETGTQYKKNLPFCQGAGDKFPILFEFLRFVPNCPKIAHPCLNQIPKEAPTTIGK